MGQSVSPVTSRAGHAQMWEFGQATDHKSVYYNNNIKLNRLITKLIQLFFIFGLSSNFNFWWHFGGCSALRLTARAFVAPVRTAGDRFSSFAKYYKILSTQRSTFIKTTAGALLPFTFSGILPSLSRVLSWDHESSQRPNAFPSDDIFYTRVTLLVYRSWVLCSWVFFRPVPQDGLPTTAVFDLSIPRDAAGADKEYSQFLMLENKFKLQTGVARWSGNRNYRGLGVKKGGLRRLSAYTHDLNTYRVKACNMGAGSQRLARDLLYV